MNLPHFMIIGAARCGTSSLHENLKQHPKLCSGRLQNAARYPGDPIWEKEMHFFDKNHKYKLGLRWYAQRFAHAKPGQLCFESTPNYLFDESSPIRIARDLPDCRFIMMLRNPVDRAWSHFWFWKDTRRLTTVDLRNPRLDVLRKGIYYFQVKRWFCQFPEQKFMIIRSEDFFDDPPGVTEAVFKWLRIKPIEIRSVRYDPRRNMKQMNQEKSIPQPPEDVRKFLRKFYARYNKMLYDFLGVDFRWT